MRKRVATALIARGGERARALRTTAFRLRQCEFTPEEVWRIVEQVNERQCDPPLGAAKVAFLLQGVEQIVPPSRVEFRRSWANLLRSVVVTSSSFGEAERKAFLGLLYAVHQQADRSHWPDHHVGAEVSGRVLEGYVPATRDALAQGLKELEESREVLSRTGTGEMALVGRRARGSTYMLRLPACRLLVEDISVEHGLPCHEPLYAAISHAAFGRGRGVSQQMWFALDDKVPQRATDLILRTGLSKAAVSKHLTSLRNLDLLYDHGADGMTRRPHAALDRIP